MNENTLNKYIIFEINGQLFCIPAKFIDDVIMPHDMTPVPLAPESVTGILNLRGRVVTAINLRICLGINAEFPGQDYRGIVVDIEDALYGLLVDSVKDVVDLDINELTSTPENISDEWQKISSGVFTYNDQILILLEVDKILNKEKAPVEE